MPQPDQPRGRGERPHGPPAETAVSPRSRGARRATVVAVAALGAVVGAVVLGALVGPARISPGVAVGAVARRVAALLGGGGAGSWEETVVWSLRLPRVVLALLVGGGLAASGAALQALFRNPLADPGILGVSSGAALGGVTVIVLGLAAGAIWLLPLAAFAGAAGSTLLVVGIAARQGRGRLFTTTLLLVGVAVGALATSLMTFVLSLSLASFDVGRQVLHWILGGFDGRTWDHVLLAAPAVLIGVAVILSGARELDALLLGEVAAASIGVDVARLRIVLVLATSLVVGASVAVAGVIGFVGLIVPHVVRLAIGPLHRALLPLSLAFGGVFVVVADVIGRTLIAPSEIPVGVVTAAIGAPVFLALLVRRAPDGGRR